MAKKKVKKKGTKKSSARPSKKVKGSSSSIKKYDASASESRQGSDLSANLSAKDFNHNW